MIIKIIIIILLLLLLLLFLSLLIIIIVIYIFHHFFYKNSFHLKKTTHFSWQRVYNWRTILEEFHKGIFFLNLNILTLFNVVS